MDKLIVLLLTIPAAIILTLFYDKASRLKMGVKYYDPHHYKTLSVEWIIRSIDCNEWKMTPIQIANKLKRIYLFVSVLIIALTTFFNLGIVEETTTGMGVVRVIFNAIVLAVFLRKFVRWNTVHKWLVKDLKINNVPEKKTWKLLLMNFVGVLTIIAFIISPFTGALGNLSFFISIAGERGGGIGFVNMNAFYLIWDKPTSFAMWMIYDLMFYALVIGYAITFGQLWKMNKENKTLENTFLISTIITLALAFVNLIIMLIGWSIHHGANADDVYDVFQKVNVSNIALSITVVIIGVMLVLVQKRIEQNNKA